MKEKVLRHIVKIDEKKCNGCGECIPTCAEGAIQIIDGKARLVAENLCDGLGACLGHCPQGAIAVEEREAEAFDETAVEAARQEAFCGCPGAQARTLPSESPSQTSRLTHWPVQLHLLPVQGPMWQDADVLITADCVPFAMADYHDRLLAGHTVAVGCPKLDDASAYVRKLSEILSRNRVRSITVVRMEVPCCAGLVRAVRQATDAAVRVITIGITGEIQSRA